MNSSLLKLGLSMAVMPAKPTRMLAVMSHGARVPRTLARMMKLSAMNSGVV